MALNSVLFNVGLAIDGSQAQVDMQEALDQLCKYIEQQGGITIPTNVDKTSLESVNAFLQSIGANVNVIRDASTGLISSINVGMRSASGQFTTIHQNLEQVKSDVEGVIKLGSTGLFSVDSGSESQFTQAKATINEIVSLCQKRIDLQKQLATEIVNGDSKEQTALQNQIEKLTTKIDLKTEEIQQYQNEATQLGQTVDLVGTLENRLLNLHGLTDEENMILGNSLDLQEFNTQVKDMTSQLTEFSNIAKKALTVDSSSSLFDVYTEQLKTLSPNIEDIENRLENLGVTFQNQRAAYTGNQLAVQSLVEVYNKCKTAIEEVNTKQTEKNNIATQRTEIQNLSNDLTTYYKLLNQINNAQSAGETQALQAALAQLDTKWNGLLTSVQNYTSGTTTAYSQNEQAVQKLVQQLANLEAQYQRNQAVRAADASDAQVIEQTVEAYKAYRDQLDRIYALKKENATGVDIKAEQSKLEQLEKTYKDLEQTLLSNGEAVKKNTEYNRDKNQVTRESIQSQKALNVTMQDNSLADLVAQTIEYTVSLQSLQQVLSSVKDEVLELDEAMTNIRLVTGDTAENTRELISTYSDIAKELGTTTSEVAESADSWLRQGYSIEQTNDLIKAALSLQVIGDMSAEDASTSLISVLNGYQVAAEDAMQIVDKLTTLDINLASGSSDIAVAMSKTAASAADAGVELDKMLSIVAVTLDRTQQAAETIGRAWNSILQRMNKISAGKDVSDTGASLNDVDKTLLKVGISLRDENGILRESGDVLDEIAEKWDTLNKNQQSQVATA